MATSFNRSHTTRWLQDVVLATAFVAITATAHQALGQVATITVKGREYQETVDLPGASVHGFQVTEIRAKFGGYVKSIGKVNDLEIDVGSRVKQGDVLAVLDIPEMQNKLAEKTAVIMQAKSAVTQSDAAIAEAESAVIQSKAALDQVHARTAEKQAMLKLNETRFRRLNKLAKNGSIGQENIDEAQFEVEVAKANLASVQADIRAAEAQIQAAEATVAKARADKVSALANVTVGESAVDHLKTLMNYTVIKAPYEGVITKRMVDLGSYVQPAENNSAAMPIFQLTQTSKVRVMVAVSNNNVSRVEAGQAVVFDSIGGLPGQAFAGTITRTAGTLDPKTRTMQIEVQLKNPVVDTVSGNKVELKPGLYGSLTVICKDWKSDNLLPIVPTTAVGKSSNGNYFVTVIEDGKPTRRTVTIGFNDAADVGISSGLKVGDKVTKSVSRR